MSLGALQVGGSSEPDQLHLGLDWLHNKDFQVFDIQLIYKKDSGLSHTQHTAALIVFRNNGHIPAGDF